MMNWLRPALVLGLFLFAAQAGLAQSGEPMRLPVDPAPLVVETAHGPVSLPVEIADTADERQRGLMFRTDFPADRAMLFVFEETRDVRMWMANTPLALDMVFVTQSGRIGSIREGAVPFSHDIIDSGGPVRFTIELVAGMARRLGLKDGDRVHHPVIDRIVAGQ